MQQSERSRIELQCTLKHSRVINPSIIKSNIVEWSAAEYFKIESHDIGERRERTKRSFDCFENSIFLFIPTHFEVVNKTIITGATQFKQNMR